MARAISSAVEHSLHTGGVAGSIPASPTIFPKRSQPFKERLSPFPLERRLVVGVSIACVTDGGRASRKTLSESLFQPVLGPVIEG
jgi:hypothetical protein